MSFLYTIDSDYNRNQSTDDITTHGWVGLNGLQYEVCLQRLDTFRGWYNVSDQYANRRFRYFNGVDWETVTIDEGSYTIGSLIYEIQKLMKAAGDYTIVDGVDTFDIRIVPDLSSGYVDIVIENGYQIDWSEGNIRLLFGFDPVVMTASGSSQRVSNITNSIDQILVRLSCIDGNSYTNGQRSDVLYTFSTAYAPFMPINIAGDGIYVPINTRSDLQNVRLYLTDQSGRRIDNHGVHLSACLHFRPVA